MIDRRSPAVRGLTGYVLLLSQIVISLEILSLFRAATTRNFLVVEGVCLLLSSAWAVVFRGLRLRVPRVARPVPFRPDLPLGLLIVAVGLALAYELALVLLTPPNNWDSMTYHLSRAASWYQRHRVGYVDTHTQRENVNPPNAEILVLATFLVAHSDRLAAIWQWLSELASLAAVYVIAQRIGFGRRAALFSALVFATFTQVALEATTTQNDLFAASLIATAVAFLCVEGRASLPLSAASMGLAIGTKFTVLIALPAFACIALVLIRGRPRRAAFAGYLVVATLALGSYGFILNEVHAGSLTGNDPASRSYLAHSIQARAETAVLVSIEMVVDPHGVAGGVADENASWFGPLGAILILPLVFITLRRVRRRQAGSLEGALALALPVFVLTLALVYTFNVWIGRYMLIPVALFAPLAAVVYSRRLYATAVACVGVLSLGAALTLDHAKPAGLGARESVWHMGRAQIQSVQRPAMRPVLEALSGCVPPHARVGYVLGEDDWDYPLYGANLTRPVVQLPPGNVYAHAASLDLEWLVLRRSLVKSPIAAGWAETRFPNVGLVLLRRSNAPCLLPGSPAP